MAQIGSILLIAGSDEALKTFRSTQATFLVGSLDEFKAYLEKKGAEILRGPDKVPTGRNKTVRHPGGSVIVSAMDSGCIVLYFLASPGNAYKSVLLA